MNIFYLHPDPQRCAEQHVDKHVVKMILEYAQLLSTAHRVLDGVATQGLSAAGRKSTRWLLPDAREAVLYAATHLKHPSAVWVRQSAANYQWLHELWQCLLAEYSFRYDKVHACQRLAEALSAAPTRCLSAGFSEPTPTMPDEFRVAGDSVQSYRNYYHGAKTPLFAWKKRPPPDWIRL
jgi:hypothetical protein